MLTLFLALPIGVLLAQDETYEVEESFDAGMLTNGSGNYGLATVELSRDNTSGYDLG